MFKCSLDHLLKKFLLFGNCLLLRVEDFFLLGPQFIGIIPFGISHGLFADIMFGNEMKVCLGHLDKISERSIVLYLEVGNSCFFTLACLKFENPSFPPAR